MVQRSENWRSVTRWRSGAVPSVSPRSTEFVAKAALTMSAPDGFSLAGDLLPGVFLVSSVFNIGRYDRLGYSATVTQALGESFSAPWQTVEAEC